MGKIVEEKQAEQEFVEVVLVDGFNVDLMPEAVFMYMELAGKDWYLYAYPEEDDGIANDFLVRVHPQKPGEYDESYGYEFCCICSKDLGEVVHQDVAFDHEVGDAFADRTDEHLLTVLKTLGKSAARLCALSIAKVPAGIEWHIEQCDETFSEWVEEGPPPEYVPKKTWHGEPLPDYRTD
jgi:hypothetical protein